MAPDAHDISVWLDKYYHARRSFLRGFISKAEAIEALRNLRYRDQALSIEILEWERNKARRTSRVNIRARAMLRDYIEKPLTSPSS